MAIGTKAIPSSTCQKSVGEAKNVFILYSMQNVCISEMKTKIKLLINIIMFHILICAAFVVTFSLKRTYVIKYRNITTSEIGINS